MLVPKIRSFCKNRYALYPFCKFSGNRVRVFFFESFFVEFFADFFLLDLLVG